MLNWNDYVNKINICEWIHKRQTTLIIDFIWFVGSEKNRGGSEKNRLKARLSSATRCPHLCCLSRTRCRSALLRLLLLLPRCPKPHHLQFHREQREQRANMLKSSCLKWLTSETIEQIPNLALTKWGKRDYKSFDKIVMADIKYSKNDKGKITNLLRPSRPSCVQKPAFSWDIPYSRAISWLLFTASASTTIFNLKFRS